MTSLKCSEYFTYRLRGTHGTECRGADGTCEELLSVHCSAAVLLFSISLEVIRD